MARKPKTDRFEWYAEKIGGVTFDGRTLTRGDPGYERAVRDIMRALSPDGLERRPVKERLMPNESIDSIPKPRHGGALENRARR